MMIEEPENIYIDLDRVSPEDKITFIGKIADELTAQELLQVRELVNQKRLDKIELAKAQIIKEIGKSLYNSI